MRLLLLITGLVWGMVLSAQTIDHKIDLLVKKGYLKQAFLPNMRYVVSQQEDTITEVGLLQYLYAGDVNFDNQEAAQQDLAKMKAATQHDTCKVLNDMVQIGLLERDSVIDWLRQTYGCNGNRAKPDRHLKDIYTELYYAGQYEDLTKPYRIKSVLAKLGALQMLSATDSSQLMQLATNKQLNNINSVFLRCKGVMQLQPYHYSTAQSWCLGFFRDVTQQLPQLNITSSHIDADQQSSLVDDILHITLQSNGQTYQFNIKLPKGDNPGYTGQHDQLITIVNQLLQANNDPVKLYRLTIDYGDLPGDMHAVWPLAPAQYKALKHLQDISWGMLNFFFLME